MARFLLSLFCLCGGRRGDRGGGGGGGGLLSLSSSLESATGEKRHALTFPTQASKKPFLEKLVFCLRGTGAVVAVRKKLGIRLFGEIEVSFRI